MRQASGAHGHVAPALARPARAALLVLCVIVILLLTWLQFDQFHDDRQIRGRIARSAAAEAQLLRVLSLQQDIETGQRGYVLTGKPEFLQPYLDARDATRANLASLRASLSDDPELSRHLDQIELLASQKIAFSEKVVTLRRAGQGAVAASLIAQGEGKAVMDRMRSVVSRLIGYERAELAKLQRQADATRARVQLLSAGMQLGLLALLAAAYLAYVANVRRLREATRHARDSSARYAAIFGAAGDAMLVLDGEGRIDAANPAAGRLFGKHLGELQGTMVHTVFARPPRARTIAALLQRLASHNERPLAVQTFVGRRADGTTFEADVSTSAVSLDNGQRFLVIIRDATERRRVDRLKAEFVATVSHELRTPLTSIAGSLGLVAGGAAGQLDARATKLITIALKNSQRLVRLINDILDIEKIESGKMTFDLRRLPLRRVVEETIQANLGFAGENGIEVALAPGGGQAIVMADHDRLAQVLTNLLANAIKFSPKGGTVAVSIAPGLQRHRVSVRDQGPGIPPEFQEDLFARFSQAESSDSRSKGGTGLGLAIVKEILDRTGGEIWFETSPQGTAFHVELPARRDERRRGVLLVQVGEDVARRLTEALSSRGLQVEVVESADEIAQAAERRAYDAILVGLTSDISAASVVRSIRSHPELATTPILAAAPGDEHGQVSHALQLVDWLSEPPTPIAVQHGTPLPRGPGETLRVLHIEDDEDVRRVVASAFEGKATITAASDACDARAALEEEEPDLVILDLSLPGECGLDLLPSLRGASGKPIPVVIYTARDAEPDIAARAMAMLTKSKASLDELVGTVIRVVQEQESRDR